MAGIGNCPFRLTIEGVWHCPQCHHEYPRPVEKRPRRNCPKSPPLAEAIRAQVEARLADKRALGLCELGEPQTTARLDKCFDSCERFTGHRCGRVRGCDATEKWIALVASGNCDQWSA